MYQKEIPCTIMRGGTSKAVFFLEKDLPAGEKERDAVILKIVGSPDKRQIDGLGGAVSVTVSGKKEVTAVKISPEAVDPDDVEMLEDLIMAATNEAFRQLEEANNNAMSKLTGGMGGLGGGFPF